MRNPYNSPAGYSETLTSTILADRLANSDQQLCGFEGRRIVGQGDNETVMKRGSRRQWNNAVSCLVLCDLDLHNNALPAEQDLGHWVTGTPLRSADLTFRGWTAAPTSRGRVRV